MLNLSKKIILDPLVSIVIPVYNGSNYLKQAIDSALAQTYKNIEIIVVNDGSNDNNATENIALSYGNKIRYFSKPNGGVSSALNFGISKMQGKYFSWLSHDDMYYPQKIENQILLLRKYDFCDSLVALCEYTLVDSNKKIIENKPQRFNKEYITWQEALYDVLKNGAYNGCAFLIPKQVLIQVGLFDENFRYLQDTQMWKQIFLHKVNLIYSEQRDVMNRVHGKQLTQTGRLLFLAESNNECSNILPIITPLSTQEYNFVLAYAYRWAHYGKRDLVKKCKENAKGAIKPTAIDNIKLFVLTIFGSLRPFIRKIYYRIFRNINVK